MSMAKKREKLKLLSSFCPAAGQEVLLCFMLLKGSLCLVSLTFKKISLVQKKINKSGKYGLT